ncbi:MAG: ester cyclase [Pirellulaceae bacterium]
MSASTKKLAERWFQEVWNERCDEALLELTAGDATAYLESETHVHGISAFKEFRDNMVNALPDLNVKVEDMICDGNQVVTRWFLIGTHTGEGFGLKPTYRAVRFRGISWFRFRGNKLHEGWDSWNQGRVFNLMSEQHVEKEA